MKRLWWVGRPDRFQQGPLRIMRVIDCGVGAAFGRHRVRFHARGEEHDVAWADLHATRADADRVLALAVLAGDKAGGSWRRWFNAERGVYLP